MYFIAYELLFMRADSNAAWQKVLEIGTYEITEKHPS